MFVPGSAKNFRVLLVEENPVDARLLDAMVEASRSGFKVEWSVRTLAQGMLIIDTSEVDVILLDLTLPDSSGIETFKSARAHSRRLPIIVLSGSDDEELALYAMHEGAQDYLVKARIDTQLLLRAMRYAVERHRVEEALAHERNLLRNLLDNLPDYIYAKDVEGRYVIDNRAHMEFLQIKKPEDVVGKTVFDFFPEELAALFHADDQAIIASGNALVNREEPSITQAGERRWISTTKVPLKNRQNRPTGLVCIGRDITEQRLAQEQLKEANAELSRSQEELLKTLAELKEAHEELRSVQLQLIEAEKMKSIGRLAAGVAHEVKNPLAIITMGVEYLLNQDLAQQENATSVLNDILAAVKRADNVVRGLLDFSAPKNLEVRTQDLNAVINQSLSLVRGELTADLKVVRELDPNLPPLKLDNIKIGQVFVNVFTNAIHAMGKAGVLTVRTYAKQLTGVGQNVGDSRSESFRVGDTVVVAEVCDTGSGIPSDKLTKLYDPFFTTKPTGKGTGLGLTVTKTIVDLHAGTIDIANRPEGGAKVTIMFKA